MAALNWEPEGQDLGSNSATNPLRDLRQVVYTLWASVSSSATGRGSAYRLSSGTSDCDII